MTNMRWAWAEIDLAALDYNVRTFKKLLAPKTRLMAVVKANAYGHGVAEIALGALVAGADRFGVATAAEAFELRNSGITAPIQLLSEPPVTAIDALLEADIIPAVTNEFFLTALAERAVVLGKDALVHIKVDTGMNRIGFAPHEVPRLYARVGSMANVSIEGVFTHLATADSLNDWDAVAQVELFARTVTEIRTAGFDAGIVHCANTAATILMPESHYDMVRVGIGLYGLHPSKATYGKIELTPVMSVKARATKVKPIALGDGVSYGLTWRAFEPCSIATLPLGYADGIPRRASNELDVLCGGRRLRQVGRICMDQLMVEVPKDMDVQEGDEFVLVGAQGGESTVGSHGAQNGEHSTERILLDEVAEKAQTINYELACALGLRLEKTYR